MAPPLRDLEWLATIARGLASTSSPWRDAGRERWYREILRTEAYSAWLIGWPPGTSVGLHDHDDAGAAICVVDGELVEVRPDRLAAPEWSLRAGQSITVPPGVIHDVANRSLRPATSIHLYSPPLERMTYYGTAVAVDA
jgi:quercetin dioxygenase-like cupin family protein